MTRLIQVIALILISLDSARLTINSTQMVHLDSKDRRDIDELVFDALGLTQGERDAVYEAVIDLVDSRLKKAASIKMSRAFEE